MTAAEIRDAIADARAVQLEGDAYLRQLEEEEHADAFSERWELVAAQLEGRKPRKHLDRGPPQPSRTMSNEQFSEMWDRVRRTLGN